jgi:hypothetical protein
MSPNVLSHKYAFNCSYLITNRSDKAAGLWDPVSKKQSHGTGNAIWHVKVAIANFQISLPH